MAKADKKGRLKTNSYEVVEWVIANYTEAEKHMANGKDLSIFKCPSSTHAATLQMALQDPKNLVKFIEQKQKMETARAKKTRANQLMRDDQRRQFRFLDAVLAEMPVSFKIQKDQPAETCTAAAVQS